ncbi:hypothetical protein ACLOJK_033605 [Asimina triloba]
MASPKVKTIATSSFSRNPTMASTPPTHGLKYGPNAAVFVSSGIPDLDKILGGGFCLGSLVMIMEDAEAPHHLLLLRNFMSQGLVHSQPLLYASPAREPRAFLGTLPSPITSKDDKSHIGVNHKEDQDNGLRIAWQYKKYFGEQPIAENSNGETILKTQGYDLIDSNPTVDEKQHGQDDWDLLSFIRSLKGMIQSSNAIAVITFPSSLLSPSFSKRWQHLADTLLSVRAIPDEDKKLAKLLTGYQDMVGLLHIHKVAQANTQAVPTISVHVLSRSMIETVNRFQVPVILEASTFSIKLHRRKSLQLERLNQAPVDASSGSTYSNSSSCSGQILAWSSKQMNMPITMNISYPFNLGEEECSKLQDNTSLINSPTRGVQQ